MTDRVRIVEVGPRDGLQNEPASVSVADKVSFIEHLIAAGCPSIEVGSFVSPRWVPQMAGTAEVFAAVRRHTHCDLPVLVPNTQGLDAALAAGAREIAIFAAASDAFSKANINCSIAQSIERLRPVAERALGDQIAGLKPSWGRVSRAGSSPPTARAG